MFLKRYVYITLPTPLFPTKKKTEHFGLLDSLLLLGCCFFQQGLFYPFYLEE